jgi:hypothetical protein
LTKYITALVFFHFFSPVFSQNNSFSQLFYPNISMGYKGYKAASLGGELGKYQINRSHISGFVPLRSEVQLGVGFRKKLDLKAVHTVLGVHISQNEAIKTNQTGQNFRTASVTLLQMTASVREKLWLYGGGLGFSEAQESFFSPSPYFWGGGARLRALGLNRQIMYGSILVFNQKIKVVPIVGANLKINKHWRVAGILPFRASLSRSFTEWLNLELSGGLTGYSAGYKQELNFEKIPRKENLRQIEIGLNLNAHLAKAFSISVGGGLSTARQLNIYNASAEKLSTNSIAGAPYFGASIRYITSKSNFSSKFLNKVGIGL